MKIRTSDVLFLAQMAGMLFFLVGQSMRMTESVQGISPTWFVCAWAFCVINVGLAFRGWRQAPGRATSQLFVTHASWTVGIAWIIALLWHERAGVHWDWRDSATIAVVSVSAALTFAVGRGRGLGITDPMVRGWLAAAFRGIPHLTLAYKIGLEGGDGISALAVWAAHATALIRIGQLRIAVREAGWDRARKGMALSEAASELTWVVVTVAWLAS